MGKKNKNQMEKRRQQQKAAHEQARKDAMPSKTDTPKKRPAVTATDVIKGFTGDVMSLINHKAGMKMLLKHRLDMAAEMVEKDPLKFNQLRIDAFRKIQDRFAKMDEIVTGLMGVAGKLEDLQTNEERMLYIADKFDIVAQMYFEFDMIQQEMAQADMQFNSSVREATGIDPNKRPTVEYISDFGDANFNIKIPTIIHGTPGELIALPGEIDGTEISSEAMAAGGTLSVSIVTCGVEFYKKALTPGDQYVREGREGMINLTGNISMIKFSWSNLAFKMPDQPMEFQVAGFCREGITIQLVPNVNTESETNIIGGGAPMDETTNVHEDQSIPVDDATAQQIIANDTAVAAECPGPACDSSCDCGSCSAD